MEIVVRMFSMLLTFFMFMFKLVNLKQEHMSEKEKDRRTNEEQEETQRQGIEKDQKCAVSQFFLHHRPFQQPLWKLMLCIRPLIPACRILAR